MKGTYILLMSLPGRCNIRVGKLCSIKFNKGYYAYVGSAMNSLVMRIHRHMGNSKKLHWHIDYFLKNANICNIYYKPGKKSKECEFARRLGLQFKAIKDFGASDCNCNSHLFHSEKYPELEKLIIKMKMKKFDFLGRPKYLYIGKNIYI
ncbi:MAG: GIY-YIG nuclease family protein [Candidatus Thermoplasmatota archaeon]